MDVKINVLFEFFCAKALAVKQKAIPLHPLSNKKRFLSTKRKSWLSRLSKKKEFFERLT